MKKVLLIALSMIATGSVVAQTVISTVKPLSKEEKRFISNVVRYEKETLEKVEMLANSYIVLFFPSTKYVLNPAGYVHEVFIKEEDCWVSLGTEEDGY